MKKILLTFGCLLWASISMATVTLSNLRVCGLSAPLGIDIPQPTFSWHSSSSNRGFVQTAYQITVSTLDGEEVWNSGKVFSALQNQIKYEGKTLTSKTPYTWTLRIWDADGTVSIPASSTFETAFMNANEWSAKWINFSKDLPYKAQVVIPLNTTTRYLKIDATQLGLDASKDANGFYLQLAEVEVINEGKNIAHSAIFSASEVFDVPNNWNLDFINDGVIFNGVNYGYTSIKQSTKNHPVWIMIDLGSKKSVESLILYPRQDDHAARSSSECANFPSTYAIKISDNNRSWKTIWEVKEAAAPSFTDNSKEVPYFGRSFNVTKKVKRARMYASALGVFTMKMNGQRVTENVLEPGETEYGKSVLYTTYDVTNQLREGQNTIMAQVAGGIFNVTTLDGRYSKSEIHNMGESSLLAELFIEYEDGTTESIVTNKDWRCHTSATTGSNWWGGEDYDARRVIQGIDRNDIDLSTWEKPREIAAPQVTVLGKKTSIGSLKARFYEPLRVVEEWKAVKVTPLKNGDYLVDFGRNYAGTYTFTLSGKTGQTIRLRQAEKLNADGTCFQDYYYSGNSVTYDVYTFGGMERETWGPQFMYHGFRYLQVSGLTEAPKPSDFTAQRIRSNIEQTGEFHTSNQLLNDIHRICRDAIASQLYNTITDCPQREKLGWLDVPNEMFYSLVDNFDMETFFAKVVMDCFDAQGANGYVPSTVPHYMQVYDDDPNWGGAAILVPYRSLKIYGNRSLMEKYYPQMKRLINYYTSLTNDGLMPGKSYSVLTDWGQGSCGLKHETPVEFTITTTYYYLLKAMAEMATEMNETADATAFRQQAEIVKKSFNARFYGNQTEGVYNNGNQAEYGMALYYGLVDDTQRSAVAKQLADKVKEDDYRIKTGEIGLKPVLMSLADNGYNDVVYKMANQTDYPSYGYFVMQGCTTTPEYWNMHYSQNHCMMDHIEEWFFSQLGGIQNAGVSYSTFTIAPWIPADMTSLDVSLKSAYGTIRSSWKKHSNNYEYALTIPANTTATVKLNLNGKKKVLENGKKVKAGKNGVKDVKYTKEQTTLLLGSGTYVLTVGDK